MKVTYLWPKEEGQRQQLWFCLVWRQVEDLICWQGTLQKIGKTRESTENQRGQNFLKGSVCTLATIIEDEGFCRLLGHSDN